MSKEAAKAFVELVTNDEELRKRTEKMKPEDAVPFGKELGLDFTLEEFTVAMNEDRELDVEELGKVAGGATTVGHGDNNITRDRRNELAQQGKQHAYNKFVYCNADPNGPKHQYVQSIEDRSFFGAWTRTYEVKECSLCHYRVERHIKFGAGGEVEYV